MKVATVYFKFNFKNYINKIIKNTITLVLLFIILLFFIYIISLLGISNRLLFFCSNTINSKVIDFKSSYLLNVFPIVNKNNYVLKKEEKEKVPEENNLDYTGEIDLSVFSNANIRIEDSKDLQRVYINNLPILNYSNYRNINFKDLNKKLVNLTKNSDNIFMYSTHTSESYKNSDKYKFEYNGNSRTYDANYNMLSVKDKLNENLKYFNFKTINDTTPHDYGTYTSAYLKSRITINSAIKNNGNFGISLDIHRDANNDVNFAPVTTINGMQVAKCMIVMGVGTDKNKNEYYLENLSLAIKVYLIAEQMYPGLFRPMIVRNSIYNQDLNKYSMLFEVGATGNTLDEAYNATRCISNILNKMYKN